MDDDLLMGLVDQLWRNEKIAVSPLLLPGCCYAECDVGTEAAVQHGYLGQFVP